MNSERKIMRGEVYYIKSFLTVGHEQRSGRPAVIVSNNENNIHSGTFEICYLTLQDKPNLPTHVFIDHGPCVNSTVLCEQVTTVSEDKLGDFMCKFSDDTMEKVDKAIAVSLGIDYFFKSKREVLLKGQDDAPQSVTDEFTDYKSKAEMYEKMYNDLINKLTGRA